MMYSLKKRHPKSYVQSSQLTGYEDLQFQLSNLPDTEEKWNQCVFVEKTHWGCTYWPKYVAATTTTKDHPKTF